MAFTSLHRSVGAQPGEVTAQILQDAVATHVAEAEDLDWKADVDEVKDGREFGKDVAAMANAVGGLIVFGVEEDGTKRAENLCGVEDSSRHIQSLRAKAATVRPFIPTLRIYRVSLPMTPGRDAIVVDIPRSPEAPHLVAWDRESWRYPMRRGATTDWLGENDLEVAYASRFARRADTGKRLHRLLAEVADMRLFTTENSVWVQLAATCSVPAPPGVGGIVDRYKVEPSVAETIQAFRHSILARHLYTAFPMVGLRRAVVSSDKPYDGTSKKVHLEFHFDGSFVGAIEAGQGSGEGCDVSQEHLEMIVRDLATTAAFHARRSNGGGLLQVLATVSAPNALALGQFGNGNFFESVGIRLIHDVTAVTSEATLEGVLADERIRDQLFEQLASDLVHQFAVPDLLFLGSDSPR